MFISNFKQFEAPFSEIFLISNITPKSSLKLANHIKLFWYVQECMLQHLFSTKNVNIFMFESRITLGLLIART